jgi:DNA-binding MarR family transcriptional regulator
VPASAKKNFEKRTTQPDAQRTKPTPEDQAFLTSVPYLIYRGSAALTEHLRTVLRAADLTVSQWRVLSSLSAKVTATVNELAECTAMKQPVVSKIITEMERESLIVREYTNRDQRVVNLRLSKKGIELLNRIRPVALRHVHLALHGLEERDINTLSTLLSKLLDNLQARR